MKKGNEGTIKTAADLKGKKVGVGLGTNYEEWLRQNVQGVDVRTYDDDPTKYQDLRVGRHQPRRRLAHSGKKNRLFRIRLFSRRCPRCDE